MPSDAPIPSSWYALGFSEDFAPGSVQPRVLAGHALVVVRGAGGALRVHDAHCPHLGAHLGHGGLVHGDELQCPFHGFRFGPDGACVAIPSGDKAPPTARLRTWPSCERHGVVLAWLGDGDPTFHVPAADMAGWTPWRTHAFTLDAHPADIAENAVDFAHFDAIHGYRDVRIVQPLDVDGAQLSVGMAFRRPGGMVGLDTGTTTIAVRQSGLGHALVHAHTEPLDVHSRHLVLATPTAPGQLTLRIAFSVRRDLRPSRVHPLLFWTPSGWLAERIADIGIRQYIGDVAQDVPIWAHRAHIPRPALAASDGPIPAYRRWVDSFPVGAPPCPR